MVSQQEILEHVGQLLDSEQFASSRSVAKLLTFCVDAALAGDEENLKETTIGIFCFGRAPGYDTKQDPIVRVTARRLRNKLDLFYQNKGENHELRVLLPKGSYIPRFNRCASQPAVVVPVEDAAPIVTEAESLSPEKIPVEAPLTLIAGSSSLRPAMWSVLIFLLVASCGVLLTHSGLLQDADAKTVAPREHSSPLGAANVTPSIEQQMQVKQQVLSELSAQAMAGSHGNFRRHPGAGSREEMAPVEPRL